MAKQDRLDKRASRIEKRKGLKAGEGKKVLENRKTRRRELWNTPEAGAGKFTSKYAGEKAAPPVPKDQLKSEAQDDAAGAIQASLGVTKSGDYSNFGKGGGMNTTVPSSDRSDMSSNASQMRAKKKGWDFGSFGGL